MGRQFANALDLPQVATPATPDATRVLLYVKSDNKVYAKDSGGTETLVGPASASGIPATMSLDGDTDQITEITVVDDGTATAGWPNRWEWWYDHASAASRLVNWVNEYGELRVTPAKANTVPFKIYTKPFDADPAHTANVFNIEDDRTDNNVLFAIDASGAVVAGSWLGTAIPVANGGTGATTIAGAHAILDMPTEFHTTIGAVTGGSEYTITHNLGVTNVVPTFYVTATGQQIQFAWRTTGANTIGFTSGVSWASNALNCFILGDG